MRLFGTNGIREVVGDKLTSSFVTQVANAIGGLNPPGAPIAVGWDGRTSSPDFARIVTGTLSLAGHQVVELGVLPTPAIQYLVPRVGAQLGVIVTASHNPPEFNGLKLIAADGLEATRDGEEAVERGVERAVVTSVSYDRIGEVRSYPDGAQQYIGGIVGQVDRRRISERKFTVVLDCGNGASVMTSPTLLRRLGCRVITLNGHLDGTFPGHLSEPTEANLKDLVQAVPAVGADLGIAHDGDADRAVFVDARGTYLPGEKILTLIARDIVERKSGGVVVTPVSGSQSLEDVVVPLGGEVVYTRVGSPSVTREMLRRRAVFGGEENGGLVFPNFQLARDGAMSAAALLDLLARKEEPLAELVRDLPAYTMIKERLSCPVELREAVLARIAAEFRDEGSRVISIDGVKAILEGGWILVRPSGTEPLIRVFAESHDAKRARELADEALGRVRRAIHSESAAS